MEKTDDNRVQSQAEVNDSVDEYPSALRTTIVVLGVALSLFLVGTAILSDDETRTLTLNHSLVSTR